MKPSPILRNEKVEVETADQDHLVERYTEEAVKFIRNHHDEPFFLYFAHNMPHVPLHVSEKFRGKSAGGLYGDVIESIDWSVGEILDTLKELRIDRDTLVIFTSDNGPWLARGEDGGLAAPLRGGKGSTYEGGMREPCVARWPGRIPAGAECRELATTMDILPTFAKLAGATVKTDRIIDGKDMLPLLEGKPGAKSSYDAFYYYFGDKLQAVRSGPWKLKLKTQLGQEDVYTPYEMGAAPIPEALYNLDVDPGEQRSVLKNHPDIVERLHAPRRQSPRRPRRFRHRAVGTGNHPVGTPAMSVVSPLSIESIKSIQSIRPLKGGPMFRTFCALTLACCAVAHAEPSARLYVAPNGSDTAAGTADAPFATIAHARDAARSLSGAEIVIGAGDYTLTAPLELGADDSGTDAAATVYAAAPGAKVRLMAGRVIKDWKPVTDAAVLDRMDESARGKVVQVDLKALGLSDFGSPEGGGLQLYFQGKPMTLARWPNEGFVRIVDVVEKDTQIEHGIKGSKAGKFIYDGDRPKRWTNEKDAWLHGYWFWDWSDQRQPIASIDTAQSVISLKEPYHGYGYRKGQWYYAFNILCELDTPGEWYLDRDAGVLYFWPPAATDANEAVVSVLPTAVAVKGASHVTLRGLTIEGTRQNGLTVSDGDNVRIDGCTLRNLDNQGITVDGGKAHVVTNCELYNIGGGGISVSGGDRVTLTPAGHLIENNHIHDYGQWYRMYRAGITLSGVGQRAAHNLIHDAPHIGILFGGNDHTIELNEIHHVCLESNDAGAIYSGRNWTMRGTVIRYNYMHDVDGFEHKGCVGVYLDDMYCGTKIESNVFYKVTMAAFIGGGRDCTIVNNVFVDCNPAIHIDARAMNWAHYHGDMWVQEAKEKGTLQEIAYNKPPYSERYPELVNIIEDQPHAPKGNLIARNICVGGKWDHLEEVAKQFLTFKDNILDIDPRFVDAAKQDYRLREDSPAFVHGFKAIPIDQIGLRKNGDAPR